MLVVNICCLARQGQARREPLQLCLRPSSMHVKTLPQQMRDHGRNSYGDSCLMEGWGLGFEVQGFNP